MSDVLKKNQVPKKSSYSTLAGTSDTVPRSDGLISDTNPLKVGDIVETTLGHRGQVTAISGTTASVLLEYYNSSVNVNISGTNAQ